MTQPANLVPTPAAPEVPVGPDDAAIIAAVEGKSPPPADMPTTAPDAPKAQAPEPETPRESAVLRHVQQRERRLQAERERDKEDRASWEASFEQRLTARVEAALKERMGDPRAMIKALNAANIEDNAIAEALISKDKQSPEEIARAALQEAKALRDELAKRDAGTSRTQAEASFRSTAKQMDEGGQLPHLFVRWDEARVLQEAYRLVADIRAEASAKGVPVPAKISDDRLILRLLDKRAKTEQDAEDGRRKARAPAATEKPASQDATKAGGNGSGNQGATPGASATTTLGKSLGERPTVAAPDTVLMSDAEILEIASKRVAEGFNVRTR
jgi:hypothetical protein